MCVWPRFPLLISGFALRKDVNRKIIEHQVHTYYLEANYYIEGFTMGVPDAKENFHFLDKF